MTRKGRGGGRGGKPAAGDFAWLNLHKMQVVGSCASCAMCIEKNGLKFKKIYNIPKKSNKVLTCVVRIDIIRTTNKNSQCLGCYCISRQNQIL